MAKAASRSSATATQPVAGASARSADSREAILAAALWCFARNGFDASTTREIASRAGVNHGLIPYYFGAKLKLWQAAVDRAFERLEAGLRGVLDDAAVLDDEARTRLLIRGFVRFVAKNPEFVLMMHEEGKRPGPRMRWLVDRHVKPLYEVVSAFMVRAQERGRLPADIAPIHFHYVLAGSIGLFFHQAEECKRLSGVDPFDERVVEEHARAVEHLLLGPPNEEIPS
jgi:AcrR family transcriptional regulator